jgi:hypothetical protein
MDQLAQEEVVFSVGMQLNRTGGMGHPNIFASFALAGPAMIGVMRATAASAGAGNAMMAATSFWC